jgi:hypothetical protein
MAADIEFDARDIVVDVVDIDCKPKNCRGHQCGNELRRLAK